jgi:predicted Zn-dependent protease
VPIPSAYVLVGEAELAEGRADRALTAAERALGLAPQDPAAQVLQGAALLSLGRHEQAETILAACAARRPDDPAAQLQLARARMARGAFDEALKGVETAAARSPAASTSLQQVRLLLLAQTGHDTEARELLRRLSDRIGPLEAAVTEAWLFQREGRLDEAAQRLRPHLAHRGAALLWAEICIGQGKTQGVIDVLSPLGLDATTWSRLSELARLKDRPALVVDCCRRALKLDPENASLLNNLAWFLVQTPGFDEAEAVAAGRKAASLMPTHPSVLHTYGMVLLKCRKERDCVDLLQRSSAAVERSPKLMLLLSTAFEKLSDFPKAAQWTTACLKHAETADVKDGELSKPALEERLKRLEAARRSP